MKKLKEDIYSKVDTFVPHLLLHQAGNTFQVPVLIYDMQ